MEQTYGKTHSKTFDTFVGGTVATTTLTFPIVVSLGLYTLLFPDGRPREVRNSVFRFFAGISRASETEATPKVPAWRKSLTQVVAIIIYIITMLILIFCIPMFVLNIIAIELAISDYSESEHPWYVGQWSPMVGAILAVLAAIVDKYWTTFARLCVDFFKETILRRPRPKPQRKAALSMRESTSEADTLRRRVSNRRQTADASLGRSRQDRLSKSEQKHMKDANTLLYELSREWLHFFAFCRDPIKECHRLPSTPSQDGQYTHLEDENMELSWPTKHDTPDQLLSSHQLSRGSERYSKAGFDTPASEEAKDQPRDRDRRTPGIEPVAQNSVPEQELRLLRSKHA